MRKYFFALAALVVLPLVAPAQVDLVFRKAVGDADATAAQFLNDNNARGGAINLASTYAGGRSLIMPTLGGSNNVRVISPATGAQLGELNSTGVVAAATTRRINAAAVAADGSIYVCSLSVSGNDFYVYRWADDANTTVPTVVVNVPAVTQRTGDHIDVWQNPADPNNVIIAVVGNAGTAPIRLFTTTDGFATAPTETSVGTVAAIGVAVSGTRVYTKAQSANIRVWDIGTATEVGQILPSAGFSGTTVGLSTALVRGRRYVALASIASGSFFRSEVYDVTDYADTLTPTETPTLVFATPNISNVADAPPLAAFNTNGNATGAVDIKRDGNVVRLFHVATNNIYQHYTYTLPAVPVTIDGTLADGEAYNVADNSAAGIDTNTRDGFGDSAKVERVVAADTNDYIDVFVEGSQHSGNRMYLLIDSDANATTGWRGGAITGATYGEASGLALFGADSVFDGGWDLVVSVGSSGENPPNTLYHTVLAINADGSINTETYLGSTGTAGGTLNGTVRGNAADLTVAYVPGDGPNNGHEYRVPRAWMLNLLAATQYRVALLTGNGGNNFFSNSTIPQNGSTNNLGGTAPITDLTGLVAPVFTYTSTAPTSVESWMLFE